MRNPTSIKYIFLTLTLIFSYTQAQKTNKGIEFKGGFNLVSNHAAINDSQLSNQNIVQDIFNFDDYGIGIPTIGLSKHLFNDFSIGVTFSLAQLEVANQTDNTINRYNYQSLGASLFYAPFRRKFFSPYIKTGLGIFSTSVINSNTSLFQSGSYNAIGGLGFRFLVFKKLSLYIETNYKSTIQTDGVSFIEHSAGFVFNLSNDNDEDDIQNKFDGCPNNFGLVENNGCPDSDGDGIIDKDDKCPYVFGEKVTNGCPDSDMDGIIDIEDKCPEIPGLIELAGCPDKDEDGVSYFDDKCPDTYGDKENGGCPIYYVDSDDDGIPDSEDECPDKAGVEENKGCPIQSDSVDNSVLSVVSKSEIFFKAYSDRIIGRENYKSLNKVVDLLNENSNYMIHILGNSSIDGTAKGNYELSKRRAKSVYFYLLNKGISKDRMVVEWFGVENPIYNNRVYRSRIKNRRVDLRILIQNSEEAKELIEIDEEFQN